MSEDTGPGPCLPNLAHRAAWAVLPTKGPGSFLWAMPPPSISFLHCCWHGGQTQEQRVGLLFPKLSTLLWVELPGALQQEWPS